MADAVQLALKTVLAGGKMEDAIALHSSSLTAHDVQILKAFKPADIQRLQDLEAAARETKGMLKLSDQNVAGKAAKDWNGGIW